MSPIPKGSPRPRPATLGAVRPALGDDQPSGSTAELIARHLAGRSLVVVLDNCEHVIDEAASLAHTLVGAVPGLRLVATSREPLGVPGEILIPVAGLAPRPPSNSSWIVLVRSSQASKADGPAEAVIDGICRRLDGLPLAIELAAARLRALPLSTLAERLDDRFALLTRGARTALPRQQTLRAVVDWSYDLLFDDERRLFARLSVFVGGCELDAVEAVCVDDEVPKDDVLDVMSRLVDKSLVTAPAAGETRFTQLQTLWQYGTDRLDDSDEADTVRARHAAYYRQFAENANERLRGAASVGVERPPDPGVGQSEGRARLAPGHRATSMRHCPWSLEWPGCGSSTAILPKVRVGWPARSVPKESAVLSCTPPPTSGTATASACRPARRRESSNAKRRLSS